MVNAKLHIICGNCGEESMLEYEIERNFRYIDELEPLKGKEDECIIGCRNCSTLHFLSSKLPKKPETD